jgi:outer membrane protein OmpA-like peptidoglycan-associated protein
MTIQHMLHSYHLHKLIMYSLTGLLVAGCATVFQPEDPPALSALSQANGAISAAKQAGAADRFPDEFADLEQRYLTARGTFYSCKEDTALQMANALVADADALATKRVAAPPPPPPANRPPVARLQSPSEGYINTMLKFDASGSSDADGDPLTYGWNFGDGTTAQTTTPAGTHQFAEVGNYTVRVTVDDGRGGTDTTNRFIRVLSRQVIRSDVLFDHDKATLKSSAEEALAGIVQKMQKNTGYQAELVGHTDSTGSESYNMGLSQRRAEAVRDFLVSHGIAQERITAEWKGETEPVVSNDTREGRAQNRRTDITLNPMPTLQ